MSHFNLTTENANLARRVYRTLKKIENLKPELIIKKNERIRKKTGYCLRIAEETLLQEISQRVLQHIQERECCKRSFIRGAFLSYGSISDPEKTYHVELPLGLQTSANLILELMQSFSLHAKIVYRKGFPVIYLKEGEDVVDFLNIIGAHKALMEIENLRILKEMRNNINRIMNCESANLDKTLDASFRQIEDIRLIQAQIGFERLPKGLREIADLRLQNKDANLKELGEMLQKPIGKSGVNHRLKKIEKIAEKIRSLEGDIKNGGRNS